MLSVVAGHFVMSHSEPIIFLDLRFVGSFYLAVIRVFLLVRLCWVVLRCLALLPGSPVIASLACFFTNFLIRFSCAKTSLVSVSYTHLTLPTKRIV